MAEAAVADETGVDASPGDVADAAPVAPTVLLADGGGKARAALNPIKGAVNVARFLLGTADKFNQARTFRPVIVNGEPGIVGYTDDKQAYVATIAGDGKRITAIHLVVNPDKLAGAGI